MPYLVHRVRHTRLSICFTTVLVLATSTISCDRPSKSDAFPRKPIKVIVPFGVGGGSDTFTRIIQEAINQQNLLQNPVAVINVPGAGGAIGSRRVKTSRPDGYTILQLHEGILTSKYAGATSYGPEAFEPIAGTGSMDHVIAVHAESPIQDIADLVSRAANKPDEIVFAVGIGAPSHFAGLMLEKAHPGASFRFSQSGGGAKRFASLLGGHTDVTTFSIAEFVEFQASGIRALAVLSSQRNAKAPDIPTAVEQGVHVTSSNMHFWWAPKGTPPDRIAVIANALKKAMESEQVRNRLDQLLTEPQVLLNNELETELQVREQLVAGVAEPSEPILPGIPIAVLAVCGGLSAISAGAAIFKHRSIHSTPSAERLAQHIAFPSRRAILSACSVFSLLVAYVSALQWQWLGFRAATFLFVSVAGFVLGSQRRKHDSPVLLLAVSLCLLALLLSLGLHALFTKILIIDLPS